MPVKFSACSTSAIVLALFIGLTGAAEAIAGETRSELFEALYQNPDDRDLMLRYARSAASDGDFEAAVATLERLVDLEPANQEARLELAKAYFALGQNGVAGYHLGIYRQRADLTPAEAAAADALARAAASRDSGFQAAGSLEAGAVHSSDTGDTGLSYSARLRLRWDFDGPRPHSWDALVRVDGRDYGSATTPDGSQVFLRTGPNLALSDRAFGPRLHPYIELGSVDDPDVVENGDRALLGLYYSQPINETFSIYGDLAYGRLNRDILAGDADVTRVMVGADVHASSNLTFRVSLRHQNEEADPAGIDTERNSARLDMFYAFSPSFNRAGRDWLAEAFVQTDNENSTGGIKEDFLTYGVAVKAFVSKDIFVRASARRVERDSSIAGLSRSNSLLGLSVGWEF